MGTVDAETLFILLGLTVVPAVIVFAIATIQRKRRSKFHRQRITSRSKKTESVGKSRPD